LELTTNQKDAWGSRLGLILAMAGNSVGLGNFLRFPVQAIQNGGGAFIIPYIVCFLLMGIPLLWVEWAMGRFGGRHGHHSTPFMLHAMDKRSLWKYLGVFGIFSNLVVASYYCYLESWTLSYVWHFIIQTFNGQTQEAVAAFFDRYVSLESAFEPLFWFILCLLLNVWILARGLSDGVERVSRIGMPVLILFGIVLAIFAVSLQAGQLGAIHPGTLGLNFLWEPQFDSLTNPKVWLAAAGQIFFTLAVGLGSIQCYASYVRMKDDIAVNAMSAGWMNEFVEVVLGSAIIIPISVGYFGIDKVIEMTKSGGLGLGFRTLPFLFTQWGPVLATAAGIMFFGLLFFAGITSSLAMGLPWMVFLEDEFGWKRRNTAWSFGLIVLVLGLPCIYFFNEGVLDEFDYWAGTVSLVFFALVEIILFAWVFGINRGWNEINTGADMKIPGLFKYIILYVTPIMLILVFFGSLVAPLNNDWVGAFASLKGGSFWTLDNGSIIKQLMNSGLKEQIASAADVQKQVLERKLWLLNGARIILLLSFAGISFLVYLAYRKRKQEGRSADVEISVINI
jgi:NSS family neurotransmitter:Na+ symporter